MSVQRPLPAFCAVPLGLGLAVYSFTSGQYYEFALFVNLLLAICFLYAWASRYWIRFELQAPSRMQEGASAEFVFLLRSRGWLPRFIAGSTMELTHPPGSGGSEKRRRHKLYYAPSWMGGHPMEIEEHEYRMDGFTHARGMSRVYRSLEFPERGRVSIASLRLYFADPLGIFALRRKFKINHEMLVRVRPSSGSNLLKLTSAAGRFDTSIQVSQTGERTEYAGTRPYRPGDELRHIHWPTVARTGELHVREYTPASADAVLVLLVRDPYRPSGASYQVPRSAEFLLRTTTAMVIEVFQRHLFAAFGTNLGSGYSVEVGNSLHHLQAFHDYASAIEWNAPATAETSWLERIELVGASSPAAVIFFVDQPGGKILADMNNALQYHFNRITFVTNRQIEKAKIPADTHAVTYDPQSPENFFEQLRL